MVGAAVPTVPVVNAVPPDLTIAPPEVISQVVTFFIALFGLAAYPCAVEIPFLRGTKGRILRLLRRGTLTADEIATPLEMTPNGVRFHLTELERDGLVEQRSVRRGPRKPSHGYSLTGSGESLFPKRYDALLNAVLADTRAGRGGEEVEALFRRLGHQMAASEADRFSAFPPEDTTERTAEALRLLESLGGAAMIEPVPVPADTDALPAVPAMRVVRGSSCPFKAVVSEHPEACALLETLLSDVLPQAVVQELCDKGASPHCQFRISPQGAAALS
jgi:DeoR family transcriptional regulator, suf operon transcriptional repressor